jgi:hypothetical protein
VLGDLVPDLGGLRPWGGLFNAVALLLFVTNIGRGFGLNSAERRSRWWPARRRQTTGRVASA